MKSRIVHVKNYLGGFALGASPSYFRMHYIELSGYVLILSSDESFEGIVITRIGLSVNVLGAGFSYSEKQARSIETILSKKLLNKYQY